MAGALILAIAVGCQAQKSGSGDSSLAVQPLVLRDTSPAKLDLIVSVTLGGYDTATRDSALLVVSFANDGHPVEFVGPEQLTCAQTDLRRYIGSFEARLPRVTIEGRSVTCVYSYAEGLATFSFVVPPGVLLLAPKDGDQVKAGPGTVVRYRSAPGPLPWVVALGRATKASAQPTATTLSQATLDTSTLRGAGQISLTQQQIPITLQALAFHSSSGRAQSMTMAAVTWV